MRNDALRTDGGAYVRSNLRQSAPDWDRLLRMASITLVCEVCGRQAPTIADDGGTPLLPGDWQAVAASPPHLVCSFECAGEMRRRMAAPTTPIELEPSKPNKRKN
jgi:hypothetical protein